MKNGSSPTICAAWASWSTHSGADPVRDIVAERCVTIGQRVTAHLPGGERITGRAMGLDELGHLLIDGASRPIAVGDIVHLRPA